MCEHLLYPRSIAVIGASKDEKKIGNVILRNLLYYGYNGRIYPVNSKNECIFLT
ncbi:MAG: CoA-binding protein [Thermoplasmata archaeon]